MEHGVRSVFHSYFKNLFFRSLAISLIMVTGRIGTLAGNIAFPILLDMGCAIPFFSMAGTMICEYFLAII